MKSGFSGRRLQSMPGEPAWRYRKPSNRGTPKPVRSIDFMNCFGRIASVSMLARAIGTARPRGRTKDFIRALLSKLTFLDPDQLPQCAVDSRPNAQLVALRRPGSIDDVDLTDAPRLVIQQCRGLRGRHPCPERPDMGHGVVHIDLNSQRPGDAPRLSRRGLTHRPHARVIHDLPERHARQRTGRAVCDVADELLPLHHSDITDRFRIESRTFPYAGHRNDPLIRKT